MRVLLDESMPRDFGLLLAGHDARKVRQMRWNGARNGELLRRAAAEGFDALVTMDRNLEYQQNVATAALGVVVLLARSNRMAHLAALVPETLAALSTIRPGVVVHIGARGGA